MPKVSNSIFDDKRRRRSLLLAHSPPPRTAPELRPAGAAAGTGEGGQNSWEIHPLDPRNRSGLTEHGGRVPLGCSSTPSCSPGAILPRDLPKNSWSSAVRAGSEEKLLQQRKFPTNSLSHHHRKSPRLCRQSWGKRRFCVTLKSSVYEEFLIWPRAHSLPIASAFPLLGQR